MAVNRDTAPFMVRDGKAEGVDLVAEWQIVDAKWYEIFAKAGIKRVFKVLMKFDEDKGEVRAVDQEWEVEWRAGVPTLSLKAEAFGARSGRKASDRLRLPRGWILGKIYNYRFNTSEIKGPLIEAAHKAGWGWRSVAFSKL